VGRFFETQTTKGGRYSVTLPDGTKVEELNNATAAQIAQRREKKGIAVLFLSIIMP
jgi:ferric-dicitrate binding protein FerR (iron transport regulator)